MNNIITTPFGEFLLNIEKSPVDNRDYVAEAILGDGELPEEYTTRSDLMPVRDQKNQGTCFPPDALVLMEDLKYKKIRDIDLGDNVITHEGNIKPVTHIFKRIWQGNTHIITAFGNGHGIECTGNHPILTKNGWKEAKDITSDDFISMLHLSGIVKDLTIYSYENDPDFLRVVGWYAAEGCISDARVNFTLCDDEEDIAIFIQSTMAKYGASVTYRIIHDHHTIQVRLAGKKWQYVFEELAGKDSDGKELSSRIMKLDPELQKNVLDGWLEGDGHVRGKRVIGTSVSHQLIHNMLTIALRNKLKCSLTKRASREDRKQVYDLQISYSERNNGKIELTDTNQWCKVRDNQIKHNYNRGNVYNIEVSDDNSYIVSGIVVHNCAAQTAACMKEWQEYKDINFQDYMSPQFVYNNRENQSSSGMYTRDLMKILHKTGICPEESYPYGTFDEIPLDILEEAKKYVIESYASVSTIEGLKKSIYVNGPCLIAVPVYNYGGRMWKPEQGQRMIGGHAMAITGWTKEGFEIRNSWGDRWGDDGYTVFPWEDWGSQWEVWTTIDGTSGDPLPDPPKVPWYKKAWSAIKKVILRVIDIVIYKNKANR